MSGVPDEGLDRRSRRTWRPFRESWPEAVVFGALGALPDIDLLFAAHSGPTHSLGASLVVGAITALILRRRTNLMRGVTTATVALACAAAYASHILLDWLARDATAPIGIMALWPFVDGYYESDLHLFMAISRRYFQGWSFVRQNALAVLRELVILIPILGFITFFRPRVRRRRAQE